MTTFPVSGYRERLILTGFLWCILGISREHFDPRNGRLPRLYTYHWTRELIETHTMSTAQIALIHHRDDYLMCFCFHLKDVIFRAFAHAQYVTTTQLMLEWCSADVYTAFMN